MNYLPSKQPFKKKPVIETNISNDFSQNSEFINTLQSNKSNLQEMPTSYWIESNNKNIENSSQKVAKSSKNKYLKEAVPSVVSRLKLSPLANFTLPVPEKKKVFVPRKKSVTPVNSKDVTNNKPNSAKTNTTKSTNDISRNFETNELENITSTSILVNTAEKLFDDNVDTLNPNSHISKLSYAEKLQVMILQLQDEMK